MVHTEGLKERCQFVPKNSKQQQWDTKYQDGASTHAVLACDEAHRASQSPQVK